VTEVDRRAVGGGHIGPATAKLQKLFFDCIRGRNPKYVRWLKAVKPSPVAAKANA
jgi:branched-chain amino acid aminotransferase